MKIKETLVKLRLYNTPLAIAGLVLLAAAVFSILIIDNMTWWNIILLVLAFIVLGLLVAANLAQVKEVGKKRSTAVQANLALMAVAMSAIVGGLNYVVARYSTQFDLTANKFYTLSDQTLDALKNLKQDVTVTFCSSGKPQAQVAAYLQRAKDMLRNYEKHSAKFHFKDVDIDRDPSEAKRLGIHEYNTVIFESGDERKDVLQRDYLTMSFTGRSTSYKLQGEQAFTSALVKLGDTTHLTFYFTQGHGERILTGPPSQMDYLSVFKDRLEGQNYQTQTLDLSQAGKVPDDAAVVAVAGPAHSFLPAEEAILENYAKKGGKLVLFLDPVTKPGLDALLKDFGIKLGNDMVVDPGRHNFIDIREVIPEYASHPIVDKLSQEHVDMIMPFSRSVQKTESTLKNVTQTVFLQTTRDTGFGIVNLKEKSPVYHKGIDTPPPVPLAMACEWTPTDAPDKKTRLVVFGGSSFLTNHYVEALGNVDVAINTFDWAAQQENKISIHPRDEDNRILQFSGVGASLVFYVVVLIVPLTVLALGLVVWYRRRSL